MAAETFAAYEDVVARYGEIADKARVQARLEDATLYLKGEIPCGYEPGEDPDYDARLKTVCAEMVGAALSSPADMAGVSSYSLGANGYSENYTYANSTGSLYLTKQQRRLLGIDGYAISSVHPNVGCER